MTETVWKTEVNEGDMVRIPKQSEFLCAHEQYGKLCIWFKLDPEKTDMTQFKQIRIYGTGRSMFDVEHRYLDTVFLAGGTLVLHLFEVVS